MMLNPKCVSKSFEIISTNHTLNKHKQMFLLFFYKQVVAISLKLTL